MKVDTEYIIKDFLFCRTVKLVYSQTCMSQNLEYFKIHKYPNIFKKTLIYFLTLSRIIFFDNLHKSNFLHKNVNSISVLSIHIGIKNIQFSEKETDEQSN